MSANFRDPNEIQYASIYEVVWHDSRPIKKPFANWERRSDYEKTEHFAHMVRNNQMAPRRDPFELWQDTTAMILPYHELEKIVYQHMIGQCNSTDFYVVISLCIKRHRDDYFKLVYYSPETEREYYAAKSTGKVYHPDDIERMATWWVLFAKKLMVEKIIDFTQDFPNIPLPWEFCLDAEQRRRLYHTRLNVPTHHKGKIVNPQTQAFPMINNGYPNQAQPMVNNMYPNQNPMQPMMNNGYPQPMNPQPMQPMMMQPQPMMNNGYPQPMQVMNPQPMMMVQAPNGMLMQPQPMQMQQPMMMQPPMPQNGIQGALGGGVNSPSFFNRGDAGSSNFVPNPNVNGGSADASGMSYIESVRAQRRETELSREKIKREYEQQKQAETQAQQTNDNKSAGMRRAPTAPVLFTSPATPVPETAYDNMSDEQFQQMKAEQERKDMQMYEQMQSASGRPAFKPNIASNLVPSPVNRITPTFDLDSSSPSRVEQQRYLNVGRQVIENYRNMARGMDPKFTLMEEKDDVLLNVYLDFVKGAYNLKEYNNDRVVTEFREGMFVSEIKRDSLMFAALGFGIVKDWIEKNRNNSSVLSAENMQHIGRAVFCWFMMKQLDDRQVVPGKNIRVMDVLYIAMFNARTEAERRNCDRHPLFLEFAKGHSLISDRYQHVAEYIWPDKANQHLNQVQQPQPVAKAPVVEGSIPFGQAAAMARGELPTPSEAPHLFTTHTTPTGVNVISVNNPQDYTDNKPADFRAMWNNATAQVVSPEQAQQRIEQSVLDRAVKLVNCEIDLASQLSMLVSKQQLFPEDSEDMEFDDAKMRQAAQQGDLNTIIRMVRSRKLHMERVRQEAIIDADHIKISQIDKLIGAWPTDKKAGDTAAVVKEEKTSKSFIDTLKQPVAEYEVVTEEDWFGHNEGIVVLPMVIRSQQRLEFRRYPNGEVLYHVIQLTTKERQENEKDIIRRARNRGQILTTTEVSDGPSLTPEITITNLKEVFHPVDNGEEGSDEFYRVCKPYLDTSSDDLQNILKIELSDMEDDDDDQTQVIYTRLNTLKYTFTQTENNTKPLDLMKNVLKCNTFLALSNFLNAHIDKPSADIDCVRASNLINQVATKAINSFLSNELCLDMRIKSARKDSAGLIAMVSSRYGELKSEQLKAAQADILSNLYEIAIPMEIKAGLEKLGHSEVNPDYSVGVIVPSVYVGVSKTEAQLQLLDVESDKPTIVTDQLLDKLIDSVFSHEDATEHLIAPAYIMTKDGSLFSIHRQGTLDDPSARINDGGAPQGFNMIRRIEID